MTPRERWSPRRRKAIFRRFPVKIHVFACMFLGGTACRCPRRAECPPSLGLRALARLKSFPVKIHVFACMFSGRAGPRSKRGKQSCLPRHRRGPAAFLPFGRTDRLSVPTFLKSHYIGAGVHLFFSASLIAPTTSSTSSGCISGNSGREQIRSEFHSVAGNMPRTQPIFSR